MELSSSKLTPLLATLGAGALALGVAVSNYLEIAGLHQATDAPSSGAKAEPSATRFQKSDLDQIASWHLFGFQSQPQAVAPAPVIQRTEAPKTRLKLTLQGIFSPSVAGAEGWAIIEAPQEGQKAYRVGDELPGGATLSAVETDQVILTRNGRPESLPLEKPADSGMGLDNEADLDLGLEEPMAEESILEPVSEIEPPSVNSRPQTRRSTPPRRRAQVTDPDAADNELPPVEPTEPDYPMETMESPEESMQKSPAMEAAEQGLIEEMERLRSRFPKQ